MSSFVEARIEKWNSLKLVCRLDRQSEILSLIAPARKPEWPHSSIQMSETVRVATLQMFLLSVLLS